MSGGTGAGVRLPPPARRLAGRGEDDEGGRGEDDEGGRGAEVEVVVAEDSDASETKEGS